jgi:lactate dehydrogenase-like 2-hydroxyacid dehydrogenase
VSPTSLPLLLCAPGLPASLLTRLREAYAAILLGSQPLSTEVRALRPALANEIRVLVTPGSNSTPGAALEGLPSLSLIACIGSGYDGIDLQYAIRNGIAVTNCPKVNAASVAEIAVGLLIAAMRGILTASDTLRAKGYLRPWPASIGLAGTRAGIYGMGAIGEKIALALTSLSMHVGYCSRRSRPEMAFPYFDSVLALATWADVLIISVPATLDTLGSVNSGVLAALGSQGYLVNVSRASVLDTAALCDSLERQMIAGAALDVCDPQYVPRLMKTQAAILTPHIGGSTVQAELAACELVLRNIAAHFAGHELPTPIQDSIP